MTLANKIATILVAIALALGGLATWYVGYGAQTANTILTRVDPWLASTERSGGVGSFSPGVAPARRRESAA